MVGTGVRNKISAMESARQRGQRTATAILHKRVTSEKVCSSFGDRPVAPWILYASVSVPARSQSNLAPFSSCVSGVTGWARMQARAAQFALATRTLLHCTLETL